VSHECHNEPIATAGGPEGCGNPAISGAEILHVFVRSNVRRLLSENVSKILQNPS
jgi:hypothetical protein